MRVWAAAVLLGSLVGTAGPASSTTCSEYRDTCEAVCTPERVARYYFGAEFRCLSSCQPRWNHCIRTGRWGDLEYRYSGGWERATGW